jgi:hypothetical protein
MDLAQLTQLTHFTKKSPFLLLLVHFYFSDLLFRGFLGGCWVSWVSWVSSPKTLGMTGKSSHPPWVSWGVRRDRQTPVALRGFWLFVLLLPCVVCTTAALRG